MFEECENLKSLNLSNFDTSNTTSMFQMFRGCITLTSLDLSNFDTRNVIDMQGMFQNCKNLRSIDLVNFDILKVETMQRMFDGCMDLLSVSFNENYALRKNVNLSEMFANCRSLTNLTLPCPEHIRKTQSLFKNCISLGAAPRGDKLPIIQDDLNGDINMLDMKIYPQKKSQMNKKGHKDKNHIDFTFNLADRYTNIPWEKLEKRCEEKRRYKRNRQPDEHFQCIKLGIRYSFSNSIPEDVE